jgi:uncharacterized protein (DUF302 family)
MSERTEPEGVVIKRSPLTVAATVTRLLDVVAEHGLVVFAIVDHSGEAQKVGLHMPDTKLVIFGSPAAGTPVMLAAPSAALDLPLKVLVAADRAGVQVSYDAPEYLAARHQLTDELRARLEPIHAITDAALSTDS